MTSLEKLEYVRAFKAEPIGSLALRIVVNTRELPDWLTAAFTPEFRKNFISTLEQVEKSFKNSAQQELELAIERTQADLEKLKQALKDLKKEDKSQ